MRKVPLLVTLLLSTIWSSFYIENVRADDPIVGCWTMNEEFGSYKFNLLIDDDGSVVTELLGDLMNGRWEKKANGSYRITPSSENDYFRVKNGTLQSYDNEGLIRTFRRMSCE